MSRLFVACMWLAGVVATGCGSDGSNGVGIDAAPVVVDAYSGPKRVFVSSSTWDGNLGGLAGADDKCQQLADAAALGGTWVAWLSSSAADAIDRLNDVGPWHRMNGALVFADKVAIADPSVGPSAAITRDENDSSVFFDENVWTGTNASGVHDSTGTTNCQAWTTTSGEQGLNGELVTDASRWTAAWQSPCAGSKHLLCFEQ